MSASGRRARRAARAALAAAIAGVVLIVLFLVVFPWVERRLANPVMGITVGSF